MEKSILKKLIGLVLVLVVLCVTPITVMADIGDNQYNEVEKNNSATTANLLYDDYTVFGSLSLYDIDYFKITVSYASSMIFLLQSSSSYVIVGLKDSNGSYVGFPKTEYKNGYYYNNISGTIQPGTYYFVVMTSTTSSVGGSYLFYLDCPGAAKVTHTHSYTSRVTLPTCTTQGYTTYTCSCGDTYKSNYTTAKGHTEGAPIIENRIYSTCVSEGSYDNAFYCCDCGEWLYSRIITTPIDENAHVYDNSNDTICNVCGAEKTPQVPDSISGDTNGDDKINGKDYALLLQSINGWSVTIDKQAADVTGDGKVNGKDYALLLQYINGWKVELK